jgi:murein tripeptide amidase MpaA
MKNICLIIFAMVIMLAGMVAADDTVRWVRINTLGHADNNDPVLLDLDIVSASLHDHYVDVLATDAEIATAAAAGYPYTILDSDINATMKARLGNSMGNYYTYETIGLTLDVWQAAFPAICKTWSLGQSWESREVRIMKIAANVDYDDPTQPELLIFANDHAREIMTPTMVMKLAEYLLNNYGTDPWVTQMLNTRQIYIIPTKNPDGLQYVENNNYGQGSPNNWWRKNRRFNNPSYGVDLNRNYTYMWGYDNQGSSPTPSSDTYRGPSAGSEPETQAMMTFVEAHNFTFAVGYHSYGQYLLYSWDYINQPVPEPDQSTINEMVPGLLTNLTTPPDNFTYGRCYQCLGYYSNGDSSDYMYGEQVAKPKSWAFTYELNRSNQGGFGPSDTYIQPTFDLMLPSMKWYIENCKTYALGVDLAYFEASSHPSSVELRWAARNDSDVTGYNVLRAATIPGTSALVEYKWNKLNSSLITGNSPFSFEDRTAQPGFRYSYRLESIDTNGKSGTNGPAYGQLGSRIIPSGLYLSLAPNPANAWVRINTTVPATLATPARIQIYDLAGRTVKVLAVNNGENTIVWDGKDSAGNTCASGVYTVQLAAGGQNLSRRVVLAH